jgi:excisionase family DNA binding protein
MSNERLYTTQEAAAILNVSDAYLRQMIARGKATPKQQIGGTWIFAESEVERLKSRPKRAGRPKK